MRALPVPAPTAAAPAPARGCDEAQELAERAVQALIAEALLTPKPALVDRRGRGAHHDLDLECLLRSAQSLREGFRDMAQRAADQLPSLALREDLGSIGRDAERAMLRATGGANAHRGAIWSLGLLVAASAMSSVSALAGQTEGQRGGQRSSQRSGQIAGQIANEAARIARLPDRFAPRAASNGLLAGARYGVRGARGEAEAGFPHVIHIGLPALQRSRERSADETCARIDALLAIMEHLSDTCLLHRGGPAALAAAQSGARGVRAAGGTATAAGWDALLALDAELLARWASPGGAADLLAACLFLDPASTLEELCPSWSS